MFGLILAIGLKPQSYDFDVIEHAKALLGVELLQNFMEIAWTGFVNLKLPLKGRKKKTIRLHK